jgi:hypothetical protein
MDRLHMAGGFPVGSISLHCSIAVNKQEFYMTLKSEQLSSLLATVFKIRPEDRVLTFLVDVPDERSADTAEWKDRRAMAHDWWSKVSGCRDAMGLEEVRLVYYPNVHTANNDLPPVMYTYEGDPAELSVSVLTSMGTPVAMEEVFAQTDLIMVPTEFSATAPCKMLAKKFAVRGATMPGFTPGMIPSLGVDYAAVHKRIMQIKSRLDEAEMEMIRFRAGGCEYSFNADLRYRTATPSSGMFHEPGIVGNLPSGEAYIVPYEGERPGDASRSEGVVPVQFDNEVVLYRVAGNKAIEVMSQGPHSDRERRMIQDEPAYGNIAELGHGVLGEFGLTAAGNLLMDEKLGLHIAFGRSEHFGGTVSPASFSKPENVVHIDRVYVHSLQPAVDVVDVTLVYPGGRREVIMRNNEWTVEDQDGGKQ